MGPRAGCWLQSPLEHALAVTVTRVGTVRRVLGPGTPARPAYNLVVKDLKKDDSKDRQTGRSTGREMDSIDR